MNDLHKKLREGCTTSSASETEELARRFAQSLKTDSVLALHGNLGVGKTTFVRGMAIAWGITEAITSPTFNLYSVYQGESQLVHLDAYRLSSGDDLDALMIDDFLQSPWCFAVEWAEHIEDALPDDTWHLYLSITETNAHFIRLEGGPSTTA